MVQAVRILSARVGRVGSASFGSRTFSRMWTERGTLSIDGASVFDLDSPTLEDTLRISVAPPVLYDAFDYKLPTLYVLDGNACLPMVSSIARTLQMLAFGSIPPVICVGVCYATNNLLDVSSLRTRDL